MNGCPLPSGTPSIEGRIAPLAHDPPKCERFGEKIMRSFNSLERDRTEDRIPLFLNALYRSAPPPRLQRMNFPSAMAGLAGGALQPAFRPPVDIARQKIPAGASLRGIGMSQRRYRSPRAGLGRVTRRG